MLSKSNVYRKDNWKKCVKRERLWGKKYYYKVRDEIFNLLGDKCIKCGNIDKRVLQIDHVDGGGNSRKIKGRSGQGARVKIRNELRDGSDRYQLLCANCNIIKKFENNEIKGHMRADFYKQDLSEKASKQRKTIKL